MRDLSLYIEFVFWLCFMFGDGFRDKEKMFNFRVGK